MTPKDTVHQLLNDPVAGRLLQSTIPARLAYTWSDGTPRVVPIWFHWNGTELVVVSPPGAPKLRVLGDRPDVAVTIDSEGATPNVLLVRGRAAVEEVEGIAPEYAAAAQRYLGSEAGRAWVDQIAGLTSRTYRVVITPHWVEILDFQTRFPSAIRKAMAGTGS